MRSWNRSERTSRRRARRPAGALPARKTAAGTDHRVRSHTARGASATLRPVNGDGTSTAFRAVPRTGVIFVTTEAVKRGYSGRDASWCNLGQGQPETGDIPGAPA